MEEILDAPVSAEKRMEYAGFWIRVAAAIIDGIVIQIAMVILMLFFVGGYSMFDPSTGFSAVGVLLLIGAYVGYFTLLESSSRQATLGKLAVGIKVGDKNGAQLSFANALGRFFSKFLSGMILYLGYIMIAWDERKQGLHDKIADTYVFYSNRN